MLLLRLGRRRRLIVANMSPELQHVRIRLQASGSIRITTLDHHSAADAMRDPEAFRKAAAGAVEAPSGGVLSLGLLPYAIRRIDFSA